MKNIIRLLSLIVCCLLLGGLPARAGEEANYFKAKIKIQMQPTGYGKVYAAYSSAKPEAGSDSYKGYTNNEPPVFDVNDGDSHMQSTNDWRDFYLFYDLNPGKYFINWTDENGTVIGTDNGQKVNRMFYKESKGVPTYAFTAHFGSCNISVDVNDANLGSAAISNPDNAEGDEVTLTATPKSRGRFVRWEKADGTVLSTSNPYTFTVSEVAKYVGVFEVKEQRIHGAGYYRVQSAASRHIALTGKWKPNFLSSSDPNYAFEGKILDGLLDIQHSDGILNYNPASIFYLSGTFKDLDKYADGTEYCADADLESCGISVKELMGTGFKVGQKGGALRGTYKLLGPQSLLLMANYNLVAAPVQLAQDQEAYADHRAWEFEPLDEEHINSYYFTANTAQKFQDADGYYWSTMYTSFPYRIYDTGNVEAFVVSHLRLAGASALPDLDGHHLDTEHNLAEVSPVGEYIPANTPVLLRFRSAEPKDCRLLPLEPDTEVAQLTIPNLLRVDTDNPYNLYTSKQDYINDHGITGRNAQSPLFAEGTTAGSFKLSLPTAAGGRALMSLTEETIPSAKPAARAVASTPDAVPVGFRGTVPDNMWGWNSYASGRAPVYVWLDASSAGTPVPNEFHLAYRADDPTGIEAVEAEPSEDHSIEMLYDLSGRLAGPRCEVSTPGLYISSHGRKVLVR